MMNGWDMSGWGWVWMTLMMGIGIVLVALLIVALFRSPQTPAPPPSEDAVALLRRRFAAGEIDQQEFRRRSDELASSVRP